MHMAGPGELFGPDEDRMAIIVDGEAFELIADAMSNYRDMHEDNLAESDDEDGSYEAYVAKLRVVNKLLQERRP